MAKALTKEDLVYILQSIFKISAQENNAFQMLNDGLYAEGHHVDLQAHEDDSDKHIDACIREILTKFSVSSEGLLLYGDKVITTSVSKKEGNSIGIEEDGLYG